MTVPQSPSFLGGISTTTYSVGTTCLNENGGYFATVSKNFVLPDFDGGLDQGLLDCMATFAGSQSTMSEGDVFLARGPGGSGAAQFIAEFDAELSWNPNYPVIRKKYG